MGDPGPAKRCIEIIYNMIYETSSPKVRKAFRRSIAQCYAGESEFTGCRQNQKASDVSFFYYPEKMNGLFSTESLFGHGTYFGHKFKNTNLS